MKIIFFEDEKYKDFLPLVYFRPVWELRCGAKLLIEKSERIFGNDIYLIARNYLEELYLDKNRLAKNLVTEEDCLFLNSRVIFTADNLVELKSLKEKEALVQDKNVLAFCAPVSYIQNNLNNDGTLCTTELFQKETAGYKVLDYIWDCIYLNGEEIKDDFANFVQPINYKGDSSRGIYVVGDSPVHLADDVLIEPNVVLNSEDGPIWLDTGARVMSGSVIKGPCYIGKKSQIKIGSQIYPNTSIGEVCKIGGEVEDVIFHSYTNKIHNGVFAHSYLGSWVNIGGDTVTSDLKNTYGEITVKLNGKDINTGKTFLGSIIGDHSKIAINTSLNTGTIIGTNSNLFGGMPPKFTPSFSWNNQAEYELAKAIQVAGKVMARRDISFDGKMTRLFEEVYKLSKEMEKAL